MNRKELFITLLTFSLTILFIVLALPAKAEVGVKPYATTFVIEEVDDDDTYIPRHDQYADNPRYIRMIPRQERDQYADNPRYIRIIERQRFDQRVRQLRPCNGNWNSRDQRVEGLHPRNGVRNERDQRVRGLRPCVGHWGERDQRVENLRPRVGHWCER